jgi:gamma-glutamyltranspeptidase
MFGTTTLPAQKAQPAVVLLDLADPAAANPIVTANHYMVTASHPLAARAGSIILEKGGNAVEAMVAAASTVAVVYPHMNSIGGDNFWLIASNASKYSNAFVIHNGIIKKYSHKHDCLN